MTGRDALVRRVNSSDMLPENDVVAIVPRADRERIEQLAKMYGLPKGRVAGRLISRALRSPDLVLAVRSEVVE